MELAIHYNEVGQP